MIDVIKKIAEQEAQRIQTTELGIVTAVFPHTADDDKENYQCSVTLKNKKQADGSDFELRQVPIATPYMGLVCIPNVGDLVVVTFIGGDINAPIIIGRLYNDQDRPPINKPNEFLLQHTIKEGGSIKLDENGKIIATSKDEKNVVTLEDEKISIVNEKFSLVIDISGQKIVISSDKDLELIAQHGKFSVTANEVEITSQKGVSIKGGEDVALQSQKNVDIKATSNCNLEGTAGAALKTGGLAKVILNPASVNINDGALEVT